MRPPTLARALASLLADPADRPFLLQDLDDRFRDLAVAEGARAARRSYWWQALSVVRLALLPSTPFEWRGWAGVTTDIRTGYRTLVRHRAYALGACGTLGLGLATAVLTFAVAWNVWLAPSAIPDADRVVKLHEIGPPDPTIRPIHSRRAATCSRPPWIGDILDQEWETIEAVADVGQSVVRLERETGTQLIAGASLGRQGFRMLGIVPLLGRLPTDPEREVLLTERFWRSDFGADPEVLNVSLNVAGRTLSVVGVARFQSGHLGDPEIVRVTDPSWM